MRVLATVAAAVVAATVAGSSAEAVDVRIQGFYDFGCVTPDGEKRKPKFGDVDGVFFTNLPAEQKPCLETIDRMVYSCGANTTFISHDLNDRFPSCLRTFERQAERCVRHFEQERQKCYAGDSPVPQEAATGPDAPEVEPADLTMWAAKRSNIRSGPGTDHAKVGLLEIGDEVQVTGEIGDWLRIEAPGGGDGFVWTPLLTGEAPSRPSAASGAETARALGIPDKAMRDRVASRVGRCNELWWFRLSQHAKNYGDLAEKREQERFLQYLGDHSDQTLIADAREFIRACAPLSVMLRDAGLPCAELAHTIGAGGHTTPTVMRNAEELLEEGRLDTALKNAVEDYLRTCVPAYATVIDGKSESSVARTSDQPLGRGPLHGSITFSQDADGGYAWGIAWSFDNHPVALAESLDQCREYGGRSCTEVGWFQDACGALAIGDDNGYGAGWGDTAAAAERDALSQCRAANENCRIEVTRCSKSQEAGGKGGRQKEEALAVRETERAETAAVELEPKCEFPIQEECWRETANKSGCYFWDGFGGLGTGQSSASWSGSCSNGLANGQGTLKWPPLTDKPEFPDGVAALAAEFSGGFLNGILHGRFVMEVRPFVISGYEVLTTEGTYVNGKLHGNIRTHSYHPTGGEERCEIQTYDDGEWIGWGGNC